MSKVKVPPASSHASERLTFATRLGSAEVRTEENRVVSIRFLPGSRRTKSVSAAKKAEPSAAAVRAARALAAYASGKSLKLDLPHRLTGSDFEVRVWKAAQKIPAGQTRTYGELARAIGRPKACRAVGTALGRNPLWILVPCHRVVGQSGLGGYAGGLELKSRLLRLEKSKKSDCS